MQLNKYHNFLNTACPYNLVILNFKMAKSRLAAAGMLEFLPPDPGHIMFFRRNYSFIF